MKTFLLALFLCITLSTTPSGANDRPNTRGFLIDPSKHYVYIKFDHVAHREPLSPDETAKGLWLRLVNNCRVPITVAIFNTENAGPDPGVGVYDEVVPLAVKSGLPILGLAENRPKAIVTPKEDPPPEGYTLPDTFSTTTISPGDSLLFNLPLNHVGPSWSLQIRFYLETSYGSGPYSVVSFDWQDIPEKLRQN
jgi:hypothetical protein